MSCEITGKLVEKLQPVSGESRNGKWEKQEFVIETYDQYPKKICISLWNDKVSALGNFTEGDKIKASLNVSSREYNGKWYTDVVAWRLEKEADEGMNLPPVDELPPAIGESDDDLPF
jgi:hypothetical protein